MAVRRGGRCRPHSAAEPLEIKRGAQENPEARLPIEKLLVVASEGRIAVIVRDERNLRQGAWRCPRWGSGDLFLEIHLLIQ